MRVTWGFRLPAGLFTLRTCHEVPRLSRRPRFAHGKRTVQAGSAATTGSAAQPYGVRPLFQGSPCGLYGRGLHRDLVAHAEAW